MSIPCYCPNCRNIFLSRAIHIENSINISFGGGSEPCIYCGRQASILDGTYNSIDGVLEVVEGSDFTKFAAKQLQNIAMDLYYNKKSVDSSLNDIIRIDPELGGKLKRFAESNKGTQAKYLLIIALLLFAYQYTSGFVNKTGQIHAESLFGNKPNEVVSQQYDQK